LFEGRASVVQQAKGSIFDSSIGSGGGGSDGSCGWCKLPFAVGKFGMMSVRYPGPSR